MPRKCSTLRVERGSRSFRRLIAPSSRKAAV
jgi:hypothetical protein